MKSFSLAGKISGRAILDLFIEGNYLAVIFLIPLWFSYWFPTYNIFELNKIILFQVLVALLFLATGWKILFYPPALAWPPLQFFKKYWLLPTVFIVGLSLTLFSSINPVLSFYGTIQRQAGLSSYLFYFLWFILVSFNLLTIHNQRSGSGSGSGDSSRTIRRVLMAAVLSGAVVSLYGILQFLNIDFLVWPEPAFLTQRAFSSFGQPNFLASWLLLVIPLSVYLLLTSRQALCKFGWLLALASQLLALFMSGSRGGLIALLGVLALLLVYELAVSAWPRRKKYWAVALFVFLSCLALLLLDYSSHGRVRQLLHITDGSLGARVDLYQAAGSAITARPWLGYGLETGNEIFIRYYTPEWGIYGDVGQSADRAHNLILDILLVAGLWGLLLYSGLYYFGGWLVSNNLKNKRHASLSLALSGGLLGYLFSLFFSFSFVGGEVYFWLFLAILVALNGNAAAPTRIGGVPTGEAARPNSRQPLPVIKILVALGLTLITWLQISQSVRSLIADYYFEQLYYRFSASNLPAVFLWYEDLCAAGPNPINQAFYDYSLADSLNALYPNLTDPRLRRLVLQKLAGLDQALPAWGYENLLIKSRLNLTLHNFVQAQTYLAPVLAITPHWPPVYLAQGELAGAEGNSRGALLAYYVATLNLPSENDPRLNDLHRQVLWQYQYLINQRMADIFLEQKNYVTAAKYYQLAYHSQVGDFSLLKKIADTYYLRGDLKAAIIYNQHGWERDPSDENWPVALGILYYEQGDHGRAVFYLNQARRLAPYDREIQKLLDQYNK
jgi:putative inorganic carbon (HCO3(-)) transporter